ncbi:DUF6247 family protein [Mycobacteroides abscessus]|uniref:DUF6247 family protein n=1 Tax=Mycobacteroides abscessus TaxID=36809 RepID=UPI001F3D9561|nr:DUF6247 family protein [Mycobacteroides abscessus]
MPEDVLLPRNGPAIRAALAKAAPDELPEFEAEFRIALAETDNDFDLARMNRVLDRWLGRLHLRLKPTNGSRESCSSPGRSGRFPRPAYITANPLSPSSVQTSGHFPVLRSCRAAGKSLHPCMVPCRSCQKRLKSATPSSPSPR